MKKVLVTLALMLFGTADAYEYRLQFTPPPGARGVNVVGYAFTDAGGVSGLIHYALVRCSSGRGAHCITTQYDYSATWDLFGNPTGSVAGAPTAPAPLYVDGTRTVYADNGTNQTGSDSAIAGVDKGFVITPSSHYAWQSPNGQLYVIPDSPYTFHGQRRTVGFPQRVSKSRRGLDLFGRVRYLRLSGRVMRLRRDLRSDDDPVHPFDSGSDLHHHHPDAHHGRG